MNQTDFDSHVSKIAILLSAIFISLILMALMSADQISVALPALIITNTLICTMVILWQRDGSIPVFDIGFICLSVTSGYAVIPLLQFLLSDMTWTVLSDNRLLSYDPSPSDFGSFAWLPAIYIVSMAFAYVTVRGKIILKEIPPQHLPQSTMKTFLAFIVFITAYVFVVERYFGVNLSPSHAEAREAFITGAVQQLPLLIRQITHNLYGMLTILKIGLIIIFMQRWRRKFWRYLLLGWLGFEVFGLFIKMGSRSELVFLFLAAALAYHRLVKTVRPWKMMVFAVLLIVGAIAYGFARDYMDTAQDVSVEMDRSMFSAATEFQMIYGTAYDLMQRKLEGSLPEVPWQVYASDLLMLVPQQFLPFEKWDPSDWYLQVIGHRGLGVGYMFGVVSQSIIGFGWIELVIRGLVFGSALAIFRRWYEKRAGRFWPTLLYIWLGVWSYYNYRATSFYIVTFIMYRFLPVYLLVTLCGLLYKRPLVFFRRVQTAH